MPAPISIGPRKYISGCRPTSTIHIWIGVERTVIRWASTGSSASLSDCGGQMRLSVFSRRHMRNRRGAPPRLVPHACWAPRFCRYARHPKTSPTRGSGSPDSMPMRPRTRRTHGSFAVTVARYRWRRWVVDGDRAASVRRCQPYKLRKRGHRLAEDRGWGWAGTADLVDAEDVKQESLQRGHPPEVARAAQQLGLPGVIRGYLRPVISVSGSEVA